MTDQIRAIIIPITEERRLLLPNAMVAEVMNYRKPDNPESKYAWHRGEIEWRGWSVPLIDFASLTDHDVDVNESEFKNIAILKSINYSDKLPFFAVISRGIPKLHNVSRGDMQMHENTELTHNAISSLVTINEETADIPNMNYLESNLIKMQEGTL